MTNSFQGLSTCFLTEERRFDYANRLQIGHGNIYSQTRPDCRTVLMKIQYETEEHGNYVSAVLDRVRESETASCICRGGNFVPNEPVRFMQYVQNLIKADETEERVSVIVHTKNRKKYFAC